MTNPTGPYGGNQPPQNPYGAPQQPQNPYGAPAAPAQSQNPYGQPQQGAPAGYPPPQNPYGAPQGAPQQAPPNPYAGQQPPQNPYGQPQNANNPYGQQPQNQYGQVPPNPYGTSQGGGGFLKKGRGSLGKVRIIVGAVVLVVGGGFAIYNHFKSPSSAHAGDCLSVNTNAGSDTAIAKSAKKVSCSDSSANFTVLGRIDSSDTTKCSTVAGWTDADPALYQEGSGSYVLCLKAKQ